MCRKGLDYYTSTGNGGWESQLVKTLHGNREIASLNPTGQSVRLRDPTRYEAATDLRFQIDKNAAINIGFSEADPLPVAQS